MDSRASLCSIFSLLLISSLFSFQAKAAGSGSVFFIDGPSHPYIRPHFSSDSSHATDPLSLLEVGAAVSVLLGFAPSRSLSAESSSKLNEVLMPNPFDRPRSVFLLEVTGAKGSQHVADPHNYYFSNSVMSKVIYDKNEVDIHLPDEDKLSVIPLNDPLSLSSDPEFSDTDLNDFASWLGGSYVANTLKPLNGELTIFLKNGAQLKLHMSKKADKEFVVSLLSLTRDIERAMEMHQDLSGNVHNPAELMTGSFSGIKSLQEEYGTDGIVAQQGTELFVTSVSKIFESLQTVHKGQIVGVIFLNGSPSSELESLLDVKFTSQPSPRILEEKTSGVNAIHLAEILLVRRTLAWLTGIILLIATLLGTYFLLYMPITRDTLLYSNVKLD